MNNDLQKLNATTILFSVLFSFILVLVFHTFVSFIFYELVNITLESIDLHELSFRTCFAVWTLWNMIII